MKSTSLLSALLASFRLLHCPAKVLTFLLLAGFELHAGETTIVGQPRDAGDEATLRSLEDRSRRGVLARDYAALEQIWSERFVVNAPNNRVFTSRAAVLDLFRKSATDLYSSYEKTIECIAFDGDVAVVMGVETVTPLDAPAVSAQRQYTNVWKFTKGAWLLMARQSSYLPTTAQSPAAMKAK
jgi:ketosteroid isomerase-like protein